MSLLDEFAADWQLRNLSPLTLDGYLLTLRRVEASHQLPIDLPTAKAWLAERQREVSTATIHTYIRALKAFSQWFADQYEDVDSLAKLHYPKLDVPPPGKIADANEVEILRSAWKGSDFTSRRNRTMLALLEDTGIRRSELARLRVDDLNLTMCSATMTIRQAKNGHGRVVPISQRAARSLRGYLLVRQAHHGAHHPELWIGRDGPLRPDSITQVFDKESKRLGIHVSTHQFRRGLSHKWAMKGGTDDSLMHICGWKNPRMPARYRQEAVASLALDQYRRIIG